MTWLSFFSLSSLIHFSSRILFCIEGPKDSIYQGERFTLRVTFTENYPMESPIVVFVPPMVPKHEVFHLQIVSTSSVHYLQSMFTQMVIFVYPFYMTHGHQLLDWTVFFSALLVSWDLPKRKCVNLLSLLLRFIIFVQKRPKDNDEYIKRAPANPKETTWIFHDDTCWTPFSIDLDKEIIY